jgi:redox-sensitive bicupin YhaK (pirin superfamily)
MGNKSVIKAGDVQRMSAGTGLTHSEFNLAENPVNFYQIWIFPDDPGLEPSYDQKSYSRSQWKNNLFPVASGQGIAGTVTFHTNATIYRCDLEENRSLSFNSTSGRRIFIYLTDGEMLVDGQRIEKKDQARIDTENTLSIQALKNSDFILIDVPSCKGWGYSSETLQGAKK